MVQFSTLPYFVTSVYLATPFIHIAACNCSNSEDIRGTFFYMKTVSLEVGIVFCFKKVKACPLVMNVKMVVLLLCISWKHSV